MHPLGVTQRLDHLVPAHSIVSAVAVGGARV